MVSLAYRENKGATGGPGGVNYLLMICNDKYKLIKDIIFIFKNEELLKSKLELFFLRIIKKIKKTIKADNYSIPFEHKVFIKSLIGKHGNSLYVSHDPISSFLLLTQGKNCITVYHQQGSLYNEYLSFGGKKNDTLKSYYTMIEKEIIDKSKYIVFPSKGAREAFIDTTNVETLYKNKLNNNYKIIYNTIDESIELEKPNSYKIINEKIGNRKVFLTVSSLTIAKGVDLIVENLLKINNFSKDYIWILCGSGILEKEIYVQVKKYKLEDSFIHITKKINQNELKFFYEKATFYVMMHRFSIFDLATLEAMYNSTIPVLSPVGGNLEVCLESNIIFQNNIENINILNEKKIEELKLLNNKIYHKYFSQKSFIKNYKELTHL